MERRERVVLDPTEVAVSGRAEIDIHLGSIQVGEAGIDWGDYAINAFMAKVAMGEVAFDDEVPNRTITIPLVLGVTGDFDAARETVQAWATKVNHQGGGQLKRELIGGSYGEAGKKLFADCVKATLKLGGGSSQARVGVDPDAVLTIEALPDFYGDRIEEVPFEGVGDVAKTFQVLGNLPGRAEVFVTEKSGHNQLALPWHFRREGYSSEAPWAMNIEEWELLGGAAKTTLAGSAGAKVVTHPSLGTNWTPVAAKTLPHHGVYEVLVRVYTTSEVKPELRLIYDVGDLIDPSENGAATIPGANGYYILSLGQVNLDELPIGTHRWRAMLQARGAAGGENVSVDRIWLRSVLESSGKPTAPRRVTQGIAAPLVFDGFNQTAGSATGKSPQVGSAYQAASGSASGDFQIDATNHRLTRATTNDAGTIAVELFKGRAIGAGAAKLGDFNANVDFVSIPQNTGVYSGFLFRYADPENFALLILTNWFVGCYKVIGKTPALVDYAVLGGASSATGRLELRLVGDEATATFAGKEALTVKDSALAAGGVLEKGRVMLYDQNAAATAATRIYDNYEISAPTYDAVNFANRKAWLSHRGLYREGPEGGGYGPIARQLSDLPRVPVSGPEGLPVELAVLTSRGDLAVVADSGRDSIEVQLAYRPCWSNVPGFS